MTVLPVFAAAILMASIVPGPDFVMVTRNTMLSGRVSGMWTALGIALGVSLWVVLTAAGLAALLAASAAAFTAVKLLGAAYLVYLGVRSMLTARRDRSRPAEIELGRRMSRWEAFGAGLLCNLLNPKAAVFFTALMPQFIGGEGGRWTFVGELAAVAMVTNCLWFLVLANLVGLMRRFLTRPKVRAWINGATGAVMVALGLRVAVD